MGMQMRMGVGRLVGGGDVRSGRHCTSSANKADDVRSSGQWGPERGAYRGGGRRRERRAAYTRCHANRVGQNGQLRRHEWQRRRRSLVECKAPRPTALAAAGAMASPTPRARARPVVIVERDCHTVRMRRPGG